MPGREISIIIPVYNEAANIAAMIAALDVGLCGRDWEAIFVDDNSPDGTAEVVRAASLIDDRIRLVIRLSNRGLARAAIQGMLSAKADYLCVMDGDGQHDPAIIPRLLDPLERGEADITSAARALDGSLGAVELGWARARLSRWGNRLCTLILHRELQDPLTGFFVIRRDAFLRVAPRLGDPGFKLLLDILANDRGLRHREVPFRLAARQNGASKLGALVAWQFATFLLGRLLGGLVPTAFLSFVIVGLSGVLVHFVLLYGAIWAGAEFAVGQFIGALSATSTNFALNNRLTFPDRRLRGTAIANGYLKYLAVASVGIVASVSVATLSLSHLTPVPTLAAMTGIMIDAVWKYALSSRLVWS